MDPRSVSADSIFVASGAALGSHGGGSPDFVFIAVTTGAGSLPQQAMHALRHLMASIVVATGATHFRHRRRVRVIFHPLVTRGATQVAVHAGGMFLGIDVKAAAGARLHSLVAVTRQTILIGRRSRRQYQTQSRCRYEHHRALPFPSCMQAHASVANCTPLTMNKL
jgi:hypothetical protein